MPGIAQAGFPCTGETLSQYLIFVSSKNPTIRLVARMICTSSQVRRQYIIGYPIDAIKAGKVLDHQGIGR